MKKRCGILKYRLRPATIRCRSGTVVHRISTPATSKPFLLQLQIPVVHDHRVTPYLQSPLIITISNLKSRNCRLIPLCILRVAITKSSWELQSQPHNCRGNRNLDTKPPCRLQFSNKKYLNLRCCFFPLSFSLSVCRLDFLCAELRCSTPNFCNVETELDWQATDLSQVQHKIVVSNTETMIW
jgi:hypothetical protein